MVTPSSDSGAQATATDTAAAAEATFVLDGKRTTVALRPGETLLETARRAGLTPPFSCEAGNCGTCMANSRSR